MIASSIEMLMNRTFLNEQGVDKTVPESVLSAVRTVRFGHRKVFQLPEEGLSHNYVPFGDEDKQDQLQYDMGDYLFRYFISNGRDCDKIVETTHDINYGLRAANGQQAPSADFFVLVAVKANVQGSKDFIPAAEAEGMESVVSFSTDQAKCRFNAESLTKAYMG